MTSRITHSTPFLAVAGSENCTIPSIPDRNGIKPSRDTALDGLRHLSAHSVPGLLSQPVATYWGFGLAALTTAVICLSLAYLLEIKVQPWLTRMFRNLAETNKGFAPNPNA